MNPAGLQSIHLVHGRMVCGSPNFELPNFPLTR